MLYKYKGFKKDGSLIKGKIEASSLQNAKQKLKEEGIYYESLREIKGIEFSFAFTRKIPKEFLLKFARVLSAYLRSSIPLANALNLSKNQFNRTVYKNFIYQLITAIEEGQNFYQSLERQKIYKIPSFFVQSVKVAEEAGNLQEVLSELSNFIKMQLRLEQKSLRTLIYPPFIIMVAFMMISFMLTFVVPKITKLFVQMKQELPLLTKIVVATGEFLKENYIGIFVAIMVIGFLLSFVFKKSLTFRYFVHLSILKFPFIGKIELASNLSRFSYLVSLLSSSGVTFVHAVRLASEAMDNEVLKKIFLDSASSIVEGKKFSLSLMKNGFKYDESFVQAISLLEETSEVEDILKNLAALYQEENENKIEIFLSLLEPILLLVVGGIVGVIVAAMLLPIFRLNLAF